jgi:hypothetical protein
MSGVKRKSSGNPWLSFREVAMSSVDVWISFVAGAGHAFRVISAAQLEPRLPGSPARGHRLSGCGVTTSGSAEAIASIPSTFAMYQARIRKKNQIMRKRVVERVSFCSASKL